jgi:simple sugar transport system ATP-binding protein
MKNKIEMRHITKRFGSLVANNDVTLNVIPGEIHALLGENGAGKSTLMSILFGLYEAEEGEILIDGKQVSIQNPNDANRLGIGMVHQHFKLVETFSVIENIILGHEDVEKGFLSYEKAEEKVKNLIQTYKLHVDMHELIKNLTVGQQQRVEILKMLYRESDILIFDEPTAVLTPQEITELMHIMKGFSKEGKTIIIITHKLNEIKQVADRCSVLRRGKMIGTVDVDKTSIEELAEMMVGREVVFTLDKKPFEPREVIFKVEDLSLVEKHRHLLNNINFEVRRGEILGIAGIDGNGQTELVHALTGLIQHTSGKVTIHGEDITKMSIRDKYKKGLSHVPEDRQKHGLILDFDLQYNLILQNYYTPRFQKHSLLNFDAIKSHADELIDRFDIRSEKGPKTIMRSMSGGNQQKAILGREISRVHDVLIAVQPTRGLDVGAIEYIHKQLLNERDLGRAVLLVSLELDEIMNLSDHILVIYEGKIVADVYPKDVTVNDLGLYMSGGKKVENHEKN